MKKIIVFTLIALLASLGEVANSDWQIDMSRRSKELSRNVLIEKQPRKPTRGVFEHLLNSSSPIQEIVILNTENGFVPSSIKVKKNHHYKVFVVNVAEEAKNVSFIMDEFSEHHSTYYGKLKSFMVKPTKEGVYEFQCPETSAQGRFVVYAPAGPELRLPASSK